MENFKVTRSEYVEINAGSSVNQTIYFPDLPNLRNTRTWGLSAYDSDILNPALQGNVITTANARKVLVYLYFDNGLFIVQPYASFMNNHLVTAGGFFEKPVQFVGQKITWSKSYVQITDGGDLPSYANLSFVFNVYYTLN